MQRLQTIFLMYNFIVSEFERIVILNPRLWILLDLKIEHHSIVFMLQIMAFKNEFTLIRAKWNNQFYFILTLKKKM